MSTPVTYALNQYNVPAYQDTGYAQGVGNLSSYLIALATGSLTVAGGTLTLTADANFGANFGLVSIYFKSRSSNIATTGIVRLANAETVAWRNAANDGNITASVDANNRLTTNASDIVTTSAGGGLICTTPDGLHTYRISIDNNGTIISEPLS